ncbi:MAG: FAD-dependent oxidoreductase [Flavobacteriales bacterium]|nr:FAD-dependent oxidoreductase [Flavobacteriales bacterium]
MKYDKLYIASSSADNVFSAVAESKLNKKVALVEQYGFLGGDVTRALACHYTVNEVKSSVGLSLLYTALKDEKHAFFLKNDTEVIFHPEYVKKALFEAVEKSNVEVLLHLKPIEATATTAKVFGRDGMRTINALQVITTHCTPKGYKVNLFTTEIKDAEQMKKYGHDITVIDISEGAFVSFTLEVGKNEDVFTAFNKELDAFRSFCQNAGCMPMMLPAEPYIVK